MVCFKVGYLHNGLVLNAVFEALHTNKSLPKLFRRHILRNLFLSIFLKLPSLSFTRSMPQIQVAFHFCAKWF